MASIWVEPEVLAKVRVKKLCAPCAMPPITSFHFRRAKHGNGTGRPPITCLLFRSRKTWAADNGADAVMKALSNGKASPSERLRAAKQYTIDRPLASNKSRQLHARKDTGADLGEKPLTGSETLSAHGTRRRQELACLRNRKATSPR